MFSRTFQLDDWSCEVTQVRLRKTDEFGKAYDAVATITIVDGVPHIEGFLSKEPPHKSDFITLKKLTDMLGVDKTKYSRMKKEVEKSI